MVYLAHVGDLLATPDELELAVSGLAGLLGALLLPTVSAWLRVLFVWLESGYAALGRNPRLSGRWALLAAGLSLASLFTLFCLGRAASELRELRVEAPILATITVSIVVGFAMCAAYTVSYRMFRRDVSRRRQLLR